MIYGIFILLYVYKSLPIGYVNIPKELFILLQTLSHLTTKFLIEKYIYIFYTSHF
jgi:hypothetical protein